MKGKVLSVGLVVLLAVGTFSIARADTLLCPVIAVNQPNVTTIVSILNRTVGTETNNLHYVYRYKDTFVGGFPNITGACGTYEFTRSTYNGDVVSFDASGSLNGGNALFGDTDSYGGSFTLTGSGARRAYLLVRNSNAAGTPVDVGENEDLGGEAILMDIVGGAAWGYRCINDTTREDYTFVNKDDGGGVWSAIPNSSNTYKPFTFFPPNQWTTRFFVTPIGSNMNTANLSATVTLWSFMSPRSGAGFSFTPITYNPTCTAAIDLAAMMDASTLATVQSIGGWTWFAATSGDVIAYKLEYVIDNPLYGVPPYANNNAYLLSTYGSIE